MIKMIVINVTKCLENDCNDTYSLFSVLYFEGLNGSAIYIRTYVLFIFICMCRKKVLCINPNVLYNSREEKRHQVNPLTIYLIFRFS